MCLLLALLLGLAACGKSPEEKWQEQYELGMKYLDDGNYEEAVIAFTAAIEIEPKRAELYLGLAETYIAQNDFETAREILQEGYNVTGDESLKNRLDELNSGNIMDYWGNVRRMYGYDENETLLYWQDYTYDSQMRMASVTSYDVSGNQTGYVALAYDERGRQIVGYNSAPSGDLAGAVGRIENSYEGTSKEQIYFYPDGTVKMYYSNEYDADGNLLRREVFNKNGNSEGVNLFAYDENGKRIQHESYNPDGSLEFYETYEYDANGNCEKECRYDVSGVLVKYTVFRYDTQGNLVGEECYLADDSLLYSRTYE